MSAPLYACGGCAHVFPPQSTAAPPTVNVPNDVKARGQLALLGIAFHNIYPTQRILVGSLPCLRVVHIAKEVRASGLTVKRLRNSERRRHWQERIVR